MFDYNVLKEYYIRYLQEVRGVSVTTVKHYLGALKIISGYLVEHKMLDKSIYEVNDISVLETIKNFLYSQPDFIEIDERGNRMYSAGFNNYMRFAKGEVFADLEDSAVQMDMVIPIGDKADVTINQWHRNKIIKKQSIEMAHYICEINFKHITFTSAASGQQYMEGHHVIPLKEQDHFNVSLDVYANIICLCPTCLRLLHYGVEIEKRDTLNAIYESRVGRLVQSGIKLSKDEFVKRAI